MSVVNVPLVSIVTATYNRPEVLRLALESAQRQTITDWELLVIGDACTDHTGEVVASLEDPRIRFINLEQNCGEQSGPNNEGVRQARGRYLAFLNHDDLWFPDHLEACLNTLEQTKADLAFGMQCSVDPDGTYFLNGLFEGGRYRPGYHVPASAWVMPLKVAQEVGPWRYYRDILGPPSQDWIFRAWKMGKVLRAAPKLTVVAITSGDRKDSYHRGPAEHHLYWPAMAQDPQLRAILLTQILTNGRQRSLLEQYSMPKLLYRALRRGIVRLLTGLGLDPTMLLYRIKFGVKGGFIDHLRQTRGLPAKPRR